MHEEIQQSSQIFPMSASSSLVINIALDDKTHIEDMEGVEPE
jgi:hypothetical protein